MKNLLVVIFCLVVLSVSGYILYDKFVLLCDYPLEYSIGTFDRHFNITEQKFTKTLEEAEAIWESAVGANLFIYNPEASFKINLIYDQRQEETIRSNQSEMEIEGTKATYDLMYSQYKSDQADYTRRVAQYDSALAFYEQELSLYNNKVKQINAKGGATPSEARQLEEEREDLEREAEQIEEMRREINKETVELNYLGSQINALGQKLNIKVDIHNEQFGQSRQFDQGDYRGDRINIYQFETVNDLRLVLVHEFGHALGLEHGINPESIMYYLMEAQSIVNPQPSQEDVLALKKACRLR